MPAGENDASRNPLQQNREPQPIQGHGDDGDDGDHPNESGNGEGPITLTKVTLVADLLEETMETPTLIIQMEVVMVAVVIQIAR